MNRLDKINRRNFLKFGVKAGGGALAITIIPGQLLAQGAVDSGEVDSNEALAQAMGYTPDATTVDTAKFPKRAGDAGAEQFCHNCALYNGKESDEKAPCSIFQNRLVRGAGWCNAWVAKS
jgi:hypothetical protein